MNRCSLTLVSESLLNCDEKKRIPEKMQTVAVRWKVHHSGWHPKHSTMKET